MSAALRAALDAALHAENVVRLQRAIRAIQLVQRSNAPKSAVGKATESALRPLMKVYSELLATPAPEARLSGTAPQDTIPGGAS